VNRCEPDSSLQSAAKANKSGDLRETVRRNSFWGLNARPYICEFPATRGDFEYLPRPSSGSYEIYGTVILAGFESALSTPLEFTAVTT
jgi:hypothetical protein